MSQVDSAVVLRLIITGLVGYAAVAIAYSAIAWWTGRRYGRTGLWVIWFLACVMFATLAGWRHRLVQASTLPASSLRLRFALAFAVFVAIAFAGATWVVARRLRRGARLGWRDLVAGALGFFGGAAIATLPALFIDIRRVLNG